MTAANTHSPSDPDLSVDPRHQAARFLEVLFGHCPPQQFLEIRPLGTNPGETNPGRKFLRLGQLQQQGFDHGVPVSLDGQANVFFGVLPRGRRGGKATDVDLATCLWADLDRGWPETWPESLPHPSIVVESSPGHFQCYWLLTEPTTETHRVSGMVRRLALPLGGDNVSDLPRILRLPGFQNLKYLDRPVAKLRELQPEYSFTLDQLDSVLPPLSEDQKGCPWLQQSRNPGPFDTHAGGGDVPHVVLVELQRELILRGSRWHSDGRLTGPCPFQHVTGPCDCERGFYFSPISGRWWCFCTDHPDRDPAKSCVGGRPWSLWSALFPGRRSPRSEKPQMSASPPLNLREEEASNSSASIYDPPVPATIEALSNSPRHRHTADLLRLVGLTEKASAEANCGIPLKGKCPKPQHGVVRELRASGKTQWCSGCNTETSAKYLNVRFPEGAFSILRMQVHLGEQSYDAAEMGGGMWEIDPKDGQRIADLLVDTYQSAVKHFRKVQRRYGYECLGWHFAVGHSQQGLWAEIQVLVRHSSQLTRVMQELTGDTRQRASFLPDTVIRSDYPVERKEQLRRDWAGLLKCALLSLEDDVLFIPIYLALGKCRLCQAYGDLRAAYSVALEEERNGQREDVKTCPVVDEEGQVCGCQLTFFLDPLDQHPLNHEVLNNDRAASYTGRSGP